VTNQLVDSFYVLSGTLIEKCSFLAACQFHAKLGAIDQVTLGNQPVDADMRSTCWPPLVYFSV